MGHSQWGCKELDTTERLTHNIKYTYIKFIILTTFFFQLFGVFIAVGERGLLFAVVHGLLMAVASHVLEHGL